jgi:hypothetical protein
MKAIIDLDKNDESGLICEYKTQAEWMRMTTHLRVTLVVKPRVRPTSVTGTPQKGFLAWRSSVALRSSTQTVLTRTKSPSCTTTLWRTEMDNIRFQLYTAWRQARAARFGLQFHRRS